MAKRMTIKVEEIKDRVNKILALPNIDQEVKSGFCVFLESILIETKNYNGFNSLTWLNGGCHKWKEDGSPKDIKAKYMGLEYDRFYF